MNKEFVWMSAVTAEFYVLADDDIPAKVLGKGVFYFLGEL